MSIHPSPGPLTAIARHFHDPRVGDSTWLTIRPDGDGSAPAFLSPHEAREALRGVEADPALSALVWREALCAARSDSGPRGYGQLLLLYLVLPQMRSTVHYICGRLRADRADVEAEMLLAFLEELRAVDLSSPPAMHTLVSAARSAAWRFVRAGLRETPSASLEYVAEGCATAVTGGGAGDAPEQVEIARPEGTDGLRAALRFTFPVKRGREVVKEEPVLGEASCRVGHPPGKKRTGPVAPRRGGRRR